MVAVRSPLEAKLAELRRSVTRARFVRALGVYLPALLVLAGALALLARLLLDLDPGRAAWLLTLALLAPLAAWFVVRRERPSRGGAGAWLDVAAGADGSVVTQLELDDPRWRGRAEAALTRVEDLPPTEAKPLLLRSLGACAFCAAALLVPVEQPGSRVSRAIYQPTLAELHEKLETLEEEVELQPEEAAELEQRLEQLEAEIDEGLEPEAAFEALDRLAKEMETRAEEVSEKALEALAELAEAQAAADSDPATLANELSEALAQLGETGLDVTPLEETFQSLNLPPGLELPEGVGLDPSQMAELSEELRKALEEQLQALADAGLLEELAELMAKLPPIDASQFGEFDPAALSALDLSQFELCEDCLAGEP